MDAVKYLCIILASYFIWEGNFNMFAFIVFVIMVNDDGAQYSIG